jgi:hypothetical protein
MSVLKDKIWLTSKTRMTSERRCQNISHVLNITVAWYSLLLILVSIEQLVKGMSASASALSVIFSVSVFTLSLVIPAVNFSGAAEQFRSCYLNLDRLLTEEISDSELARRYHDTLSHYPNHLEFDHDTMIVSSALRGRRLENADGDLKPTIFQWAKVVFVHAVALFATVAALILPIWHVPALF